MNWNDLPRPFKRLESYLESPDLRKNFNLTRPQRMNDTDFAKSFPLRAEELTAAMSAWSEENQGRLLKPGEKLNDEAEFWSKPQEIDPIAEKEKELLD